MNRHKGPVKKVRVKIGGSFCKFNTECHNGEWGVGGKGV